jgi:Na+/glutamate symporter
MTSNRSYRPSIAASMAHLVTALSTAIYTIDYTGLERLETPMIAALLVRNVLLALLAAWLVVETRTGRGSARDASRGIWDSAV